MKKKWIVGASIVLFVTAVVAVVWIVKNSNTPPADTKAISITDDCWEHVTNMNIVEQDDGTVKVTLTAPDYVSLVKLLASDNEDVVTGEHIAKAVKNNPECVKEYAFTASSSAGTDVKNALMEQISYELVALTLEDMIGG